jgi:hypothetical protein
MLTDQRTHDDPAGAAISRPVARLSDFPLMEDRDVPEFHTKCGADGGLYFMADLEANLIKIGRSQVPFTRLIAIRRSLKKPHLRMMACFELGIETLVHRQFKSLRVKGEWFAPAPELLSAISEAARGNMPWTHKPWFHDYIVIQLSKKPTSFPWDAHLPAA